MIRCLYSVNQFAERRWLEDARREGRVWPVNQMERSTSRCFHIVVTTNDSSRPGWTKAACLIARAIVFVVENRGYGRSLAACQRDGLVSRS